MHTMELRSRASLFSVTFLSQDLNFEGFACSEKNETFCEPSRHTLNPKP